MRVSHAVAVRAPAGLVFAVLSTPERLPAWNGLVDDARRVGDGPVGFGGRAVVRGRLLGQTLESETEVVGFDPPRLFATRGIRGPRVSTRFTLEEGPSGTVVRAVVEGDLPGGAPAAFIAERLLRADLVRSLERLRSLCETEAARQQPPSRE